MMTDGYHGDGVESLREALFKGEEPLQACAGEQKVSVFIKFSDLYCIIIYL